MPRKDRPNEKPMFYWRVRDKSVDCAECASIGCPTCSPRYRARNSMDAALLWAYGCETLYQHELCMHGADLAVWRDEEGPPRDIEEFMLTGGLTVCFDVFRADEGESDGLEK